MVFKMFTNYSTERYIRLDEEVSRIAITAFFSLMLWESDILKVIADSLSL